MRPSVPPPSAARASINERIHRCLHSLTAVTAAAVCVVLRRIHAPSDSFASNLVMRALHARFVSCLLLVVLSSFPSLSSSSALPVIGCLSAFVPGFRWLTSSTESYPCSNPQALFFLPDFLIVGCNNANYGTGSVVSITFSGGQRPVTAVPSKTVCDQPLGFFAQDPSSILAACYGNSNPNTGIFNLQSGANVVYGASATALAWDPQSSWLYSSFRGDGGFAGHIQVSHLDGLSLTTLSDSAVMCVSPLDIFAMGSHLLAACTDQGIRLFTLGQPTSVLLVNSSLCGLASHVLADAAGHRVFACCRDSGVLLTELSTNATGVLAVLSTATLISEAVCSNPLGMYLDELSSVLFVLCMNSGAVLAFHLPTNMITTLVGADTCNSPAAVRVYRPAAASDPRSFSVIAACSLGVLELTGVSTELLPSQSQSELCNSWISLASMPDPNGRESIVFAGCRTGGVARIVGQDSAKNATQFGFVIEPALCSYPQSLQLDTLSRAPALVIWVSCQSQGVVVAVLPNAFSPLIEIHSRLAVNVSVCPGVSGVLISPNSSSGSPVVFAGCESLFSVIRIDANSFAVSVLVNFTAAASSLCSLPTSGCAPRSLVWAEPSTLVIGLWVNTQSWTGGAGWVSVFSFSLATNQLQTLVAAFVAGAGPACFPPVASLSVDLPGRRVLAACSTGSDTGSQAGVLSIPLDVSSPPAAPTDLLSGLDTSCLDPTSVHVAPDGTAFVACSNADDTGVAVLAFPRGGGIQVILPNRLCAGPRSILSSSQANGTTLFVACYSGNMVSVNLAGFRCQGGRYYDSGKCVKCPINTYMSWEAAATPFLSGQCTSCPRGAIATQPGSVACTKCSPGSYERSGGCVLCVAGTYQPDAGQTTCRPCNVTTYQPSSGATSCLPCGGQTSPVDGAPGSSGCQCQPNWQLNAFGVCELCALGWFSSRGGACGICAAGLYTPARGQACLACSDPGLTCSNGQVSVIRGFWPYATADNQYATTPCPPNSCDRVTPLPDLFNQTLDFSARGLILCTAPRRNAMDNTLCADCEDGWIRWNDECIQCAGTNAPLVFAAVAVTFVVSLWLLSSASSVSPSAGHVAVFLFFAQISAVEIGRTIQVFDGWNPLHLFNLGASAAPCIAPLSPLGQARLTLATPVILCIEIGLIAVAHWSLQRRWGRVIGSKDAAESLLELVAVQPPRLAASRPVASAVSSAYLTVFGALLLPYRVPARFWLPLTLVRRMLFVLLSVILSQQTAVRLGTFTLLSLAYFLLHILVTPFVSSAKFEGVCCKSLALSLNDAEAVCLLILQVVAIILGMDSASPAASATQVVLVLCVAPPIIMMAFSIGMAQARDNWVCRQMCGCSRSKKQMDSDDERDAEPAAENVTTCSDRLRRACGSAGGAFRAWLSRPFPAYFYLSGCLAAFLFSYTSVAQTVSEAFFCVQVGPERRMFAASTVDCDSSDYAVHRRLAIAVLSLYIIGLPCALTVLLSDNIRAKLDHGFNPQRHDLKPQHSAS